MRTFKRILLTIWELLKLFIVFVILFTIAGYIAYIATFHKEVTNIVFGIIVALMCIGGFGTVIWYIYDDTKDKV